MNTASRLTKLGSMSQMHVAHLASFAGNIGDILSHRGFREWFQTNTRSEIYWTNFEIRDIYRKTSSFAKLREQLKDFDALIVGGGNYFELWPENTSTGTSIDFDLNFLQTNETPIFFNALGVDDGQGIGESAKQNFEAFFNEIHTNPRYLVSVRNDGSLETLNAFLGKDLGVCEVPDHGFFGVAQQSINTKTKKRQLRVGINIAQDMPEIRFKNFQSEDEFFQVFARQMATISIQNPEVEFTFIPHVFSDLAAISRVMRSLPDQIRRESCRVAPLDTTQESGMSSFSDYDLCDIVIANRFHSNVYSIAQGIPTIALSNYPQIQKTLDKISAPYIVLQEASNVETLSSLPLTFSKMRGSLNESFVESFNSLNKALVSSRENFEPQLQSWLAMNDLNPKL